MVFQVKAWTGPAFVQEIALACIRAGMSIVYAGTEHVYACVAGGTPEGAAWNAGVMMRAAGPDFGLRWIPNSNTPIE